MKCISCHSSLTENHIKEKIQIDDLEDMYLKTFNLKVKQYFNDSQSIDFLQCPECDVQFFSPVPIVDENFYEQLSKYDWYYPTEKFEFEFAASFINRNCKKVLEVGAGRGSFASLLDKTIDYTGLEFNDNAVKLANSRGINVVKRSLEELSAGSIKPLFDAVVSFQVLEHVSSPRCFIKQKLDLLNVGGFLIVAVPANDSFFKDLPNHLLDLPPHHISRWSDKSLVHFEKMFNLSLIEMKKEPLQELHYTSKIQNDINAFFLRKKKAVRKDLYFKLVNKCSHKLSQIAQLLSKKQLKESPGGHVVAIFKKNDGGHE